MVDLVQWLTAQLDTDERIARAATWCDDAASWHAAPSPYDTRGKDQRWYVEDAMDDGVVTHVDPQASDDEGVARHIAEWDPARVLREIDAKRQLLRRANGGVDYPHNHPGEDDANHLARHHDDGLLRLLALPYSDRDGYQESWRP